MSITRVLIHVADIERSVNFYTRHVSADVVGVPTADRVILSVPGVLLEVVRLADGQPSQFEDDDVQRGYRHLGFKVSAVDPIVAGLKAEQVTFRMEAHDTSFGEVRIVFFYDPDGTVLELVERHITYHEIRDEAEAAAERAMPEPPRPRFDHVGHTVADRAVAEHFYGRLGFVPVGTIRFHDERDFRIDYLRSGETVIEMFTFSVQTHANPVRVDSYGFVAIELEGALPEEARPAAILHDGRVVYRDADDLPLLADA